MMVTYSPASSISKFFSGNNYQPQLLHILSCRPQEKEMIANLFVIVCTLMALNAAFAFKSGNRLAFATKCKSAQVSAPIFPTKGIVKSNRRNFILMAIPEGDAQAIFDRLDKDKSGTIDREEFAAFAQQELGLSKDEADALFKAQDTDGNGTLDRAEFATLVANLQKK